MSRFCQVVQQEMKKRGIGTICRLAALSGLDRRCLRASMKVSKHPRLDTLVKVAKGLGMTSEELVGKITGGK